MKIDKIYLFRYILQNNINDIHILIEKNIIPNKKSIERIIQTRNLEKNIKILGFLNEKEMQEKIANCKFVVLPSIWYDNCPYSILETLTIGKPVIGSDIGGIPELVRDKINGLIFEHDNILDLEEKMKLLFENKELVEEYGIKAKKIAQKEYAKDEYYDKLIEIYKDVLGDKNEQ